MPRRTHPVDAAKARLLSEGHDTQLIQTQDVAPGMELLSAAGVTYRVTEVHRTSSRIVVLGTTTDTGATLELELRPSPTQFAIQVLRDSDPVPTWTQSVEAHRTAWLRGDFR